MTEYMKCISKSRSMKPCCYYPIENSLLCHIHQYQAEYTPEMMAQLSPCSTCHKTFYFENGGKVCESCKIRAQKTREESRAKVVLCDKEGCEYKRSQENKYCKLHQLQVFIDEMAESGKKVCYNHIRGCREQLNAEYTFSKCGPCLEKDREKDHAKRNQVKTSADSHMNICTTCCQVRVANDFIGQNGTTKTCKSCRESNKRQDAKRDKEHRLELARKNDAKPERIEVKRQWKEANYEKVAMIQLNSRQRQIEKDGVEKYLEKNAERAKEWRNNNPYKVGKMNIKRHESMITQYKIYETSANVKNLKFALSFEEYIEIVQKNCTYCSAMDKRKFVGIDRKDSTIGYLYDNCTSCCKMCNYMKNALPLKTFFCRILHILQYQKVIEGTIYYPESFANHKGVSYSNYMARANKKGLEFVIDKEEYDVIVRGNCYICGKESGPEHTNGIDRIDNEKGYISDNVHTCCGECNYMKRNFAFDAFMQKCKQIYDTSHATWNLCDNFASNTSILQNTVKKTKHELKNERIAKKAERKESLVARYQDPEYKNKKATELAEKRA